MTSPLKRQSLVVISFLIMSLDSTQFVSSNFAEFLLDNANNGNEILAVLDDISEVQDTVL